MIITYVVLGLLVFATIALTTITVSRLIQWIARIQERKR